MLVPILEMWVGAGVTPKVMECVKPCFCNCYAWIIFWNYFTVCEFFTSASAGGLSLEFESHLVYRTLLSILAKVVVWMVSILPLISNSSSLFPKLLGTVPSSPIIRGITISYQYLIDQAHSVHDFGDIGSRENWARLVLDIMHYLGGYLLIVDFLWKELGAESVAVIVEEDC